jgi:hypothetical protein
MYTRTTDRLGRLLCALGAQRWEPRLIPWKSGCPGNSPVSYSSGLMVMIPVSKTVGCTFDSYLVCQIKYFLTTTAAFGWPFLFEVHNERSSEPVCSPAGNACSLSCDSSQDIQA